MSSSNLSNARAKIKLYCICIAHKQEADNELLAINIATSFYFLTTGYAEKSLKQ